MNHLSEAVRRFRLVFEGSGKCPRPNKMVFGKCLPPNAARIRATLGAARKLRRRRKMFA